MASLTSGFPMSLMFWEIRGLMSDTSMMVLLWEVTRSRYCPSWRRGRDAATSIKGLMEEGACLPWGLQSVFESEENGIVVWNRRASEVEVVLIRRAIPPYEA